MGRPQFNFPTITPVVKKLLILNFGIFFVTYALSLAPGGAGAFLIDYLAVNPSQWFANPPYFPFWQPLTSGFLHSTNDLGHVVFNMLQLYFFGTMLEGILGSRRFLWVYLGALLAGSFAHLLFQPFDNPGIGAIGASGAVLGVLIMTAVLRPNTRVLLLFIPVSLKWIAIGLVCFDVFGLMQGLRGAPDMVAHWVHLGGAGFGFLAARKGWIWKDPISDWKVKQERRQASQIEDEDLKMDDLLGKIHKEGMSSLSSRERAFLKKVSNRG